jgi:transcriptional regulator with XRE-family HTH domain
MSFSEKIKAIRLERQLSQKEMAEKLFVSQQAVSRWETGLSYPDVPTIKLIAATFNVKIDELLSEDSPSSQVEKKADHSVLFSLLIFSGAVLFAFAVVLLILHFVSGERFQKAFSWILVGEVALLFLVFFPLLFHFYRVGSPRMSLIACSGFGFFAAFSWGAFFMALMEEGIHYPVVWVVLGFALFLSAIAFYFLLLFLRSKEKDAPAPSVSYRAEKWGKSLIIVSIVAVSLCFVFSILASAYTYTAIWGFDDFLVGLLYFASLIFLYSFALLAASALVSTFIVLKKNGSSLVLPILLSVSLVFSAFLPLAFDAGERQAYAEQYSYSPEKWRSANQSDRYRMFPSFEKQHDLVGQDEPMVYAWLGRADTIHSETDGTIEWAYDLGPDGLGIDEYVLSISFTSEKIVASYSVYDS